MSQYVLSIKNDEEADALLRYLQSLDFVDVEPLTETDTLLRKKQAAIEAVAFLNSLPNQAARQSDVNKAVKSIRNAYRYQ